MGIISVEHTDGLFWLGRYTERVYTTIKYFGKCFDTLIEKTNHEFDSFCKNLEIPNIYSSGDEFVYSYCFDDRNPDSILSNLMRAYDNAIILRESIGSETLAYIQLAVYDIQKAKISRAPMIELQHVSDNILAFWGLVDDYIPDENTRNIIKIGKRIERIDLYARLRYSRTDMIREVSRLSGRLPRTRLEVDEPTLKRLEYLVYQNEMKYDEIVEAVESVVIL